MNGDTPAQTAPVILVAGLGRCGTSMVMRVLAAAGFPFLGRFPDFENEAMLTPQSAKWWASHAGRAVKLLDPHISPPAQGVAYRAILLERDPRAQAKSQLELLRKVIPGVSSSRRPRRIMECSIRREQMLAHAALARVTTDVLTLDFEFIRSNAWLGASSILAYCSYQPKQHSAVKVFRAASEILSPAEAHALEREYGL